MPLTYVRCNSFTVPTAVTQGDAVPIRSTRYGSLVVDARNNGNLGYVAEGRYFKVTLAAQATPNLSLSATGTTSWVATTPLLMIRNTDKAGGRSIYLDYIRINVVVIGGATSTSVKGGIALDYGTTTPGNRYLLGTRSNLVTVTTGINTVLAGGDLFGSSSVAEVALNSSQSGGAAAATANVRYHSRFNIKAGREASGDQYLITFSGTEGNQTNTGTVNVGPCVLGPGIDATMLLYVWFPGLSTTAVTGDIDVGYWEK
jgi:hypothetical protein